MWAGVTSETPVRRVVSLNRDKTLHTKSLIRKLDIGPLSLSLSLPPSPSLSVRGIPIRLRRALVQVVARAGANLGCQQLHSCHQPGVRPRVTKAHLLEHSCNISHAFACLGALGAFGDRHWASSATGTGRVRRQARVRRVRRQAAWRKTPPQGRPLRPQARSLRDQRAP